MTTSAKRRIPRYMPDDKPKPPPADLCKLWPRSIWPLIDFLQHGGAALPAAPFELAPGQLVTDPAAWLAALRRDVARGPAGPRAAYGALQDDLYRLRELFGKPTISREMFAARPPPKPR